MRTDTPTKINRINYIVQENPKGVVKLLQEEGINTPKDIQGLILTTKRWISKQGKPAVIKLLEAHPEKDLLLSLNQPSDFDYYGGCGCKSSFTGGDCGCKSSYTGKEKLCKRCKAKTLDREEFWEGLKEMRTEQLMSLYSKLKEEAKAKPNHARLQEELALTREFLHQRKELEQAPFDTIIAPQITPQKASDVQPKQQENPTLSKKEAGNKNLFSVTTKELAITGIVIGVTLLIVQLKS